MSQFTELDPLAMRNRRLHRGRSVNATEAVPTAVVRSGIAGALDVRPFASRQMLNGSMLPASIGTAVSRKMSRTSAQVRLGLADNKSAPSPSAIAVAQEISMKVCNECEGVRKTAVPRRCDLFSGLILR